MSRGFDWITPDEADALIHFCCAVVALFVGLCGRSYGLMWKARYEQQAAEIADLRDALADARYQRTARHEPVEISEWVVHAAATGRPRRRHWHTQLVWPGLNAGRLPVAYGDHLDPARLGADPCLRPTPPSDGELAAWLAEDQVQSWPLTVETVLVERFAAEIEAVNTPPPTWTVTIPAIEGAAP